MLSKIKFIVEVLILVGIIVVLYRMESPSTPSKPSYDANYEAVKGASTIIDKEGLLTSYIPAYSHVYVDDGSNLEMAITLSLRNIDMENSIHIKEVLYYDTNGKLIRKYLKNGYPLKPLETKEIFIKKSDMEGGSGANFTVLFEASPETQRPLFEAIMVTSDKGNSYIFNSRGVYY